MAIRFYVPKFITIEDKLAGLLTFRQLFALLGAFFLSFFVFKINHLWGIIIGLISLVIAILFTFVYINGKLFVFVIPGFLDWLKNKKYTWQKIKKITYKEIEVPQEIEHQIPLLTIKSKKKEPMRQTAIDLEYKEITPKIKERVIISLDEPIANQIDGINKIIHRHLKNPKNPYRLFPYIKFLKNL